MSGLKGTNVSDEYEALRDALRSGPTEGPWILATSNSWRRFLTSDGSSVCEPVTCSERDRHPDLYFRNGGQDGPDARFIAACDPTTIRRLLSERDALRKALEALEDMYVHALDSADGGLVMLGHSIPKFEEAHRQARIALGCQLFGDLPGDLVDAAIASTPAAGE